MARYSEMSYAEALRKEPTNYKLRAMGRRKYDLKYKQDDKGKTKVTISTKDDPKTYPSYSEQAKGKGKSSSKSLLSRKGSGTQQTNYDDIRKPGQVGTPSGQKARESQSADKRKGGDRTLQNVLLGPALATAFGKIYTDAKKIGKNNVIIAKDGRPKLLTGPKPALEDRSKTMNVNKEGQAKQGNNPDEPKKEKKTTEKDEKKDKRKTKESQLKKKIKKFKRTFTKNKKKVVKTAKNISKKAGTKAKNLLKFRKFFNPATAAGSIALGASVPKASALEDLSVAELKKMGMSDAQIKSIKGK